MSIIRTVKQFNEYKFKEKNSLFTGQVYPVSSEVEINSILADVRKKYYDATHHCYCYRLQDGKFRYSDDGEPSGTAGIRIYNAIEHLDLSAVLVIVIRYYGGIKLGVGPLGKAYYDAAEAVLSSSFIIEKKEYNKFIFSVDFNNMNHVYRVFSNHDVRNIETNYSDGVEISSFVNSEQIDLIKTKLLELTNGTISIKIEGNTVFL